MEKSMNRVNELRSGFETAYIDGNVASSMAYKPQFLSNNYKEGKKVISSIEDELLVCDQFQISVEIYNRANEIEEKIKEYWNSNQFNKDFSYYIGLHYASHLLGNAIKQEQQIIKNSFVKCKNELKTWADQIEN